MKRVYWVHISVRGKGTHSNQAPRRRQISATSTSLSLGYAERRMSKSWTETLETSKHRILMNLNRFRNFMSAILDPLYGILKIPFEIRNQRPQKRPSTKLCENRRVSKISCPPYWTCQFEKWKSDVKFAISDLRNLYGKVKYRPSSDECERDSWIFLDKFSTSFRWNSVINIVRWFKLINSSNHLPGRISSKTNRKVVQRNCEVMSTFHITLSTELCDYRRVSKISCSPYWIRHFEFRKSDVKFVISDLKNLGVLSYMKIVGFPKYYVRHIGSAILNSENPMSNS